TEASDDSTTTVSTLADFVNNLSFEQETITLSEENSSVVIGNFITIDNEMQIAADAGFTAEAIRVYFSVPLTNVTGANFVTLSDADNYYTTDYGGTTENADRLFYQGTDNISVESHSIRFSATSSFTEAETINICFAYTDDAGNTVTATTGITIVWDGSSSGSSTETVLTVSTLVDNTTGSYGASLEVVLKLADTSKANLVEIKSVTNEDQDDCTSYFTYSSSDNVIRYSVDEYPPVGTYIITLGVTEAEYTLSKDTTTVIVTSRDYTFGNLDTYGTIEYGEMGTVGDFSVTDPSVTGDDLSYTIMSVTKDGISDEPADTQSILECFELGAEVDNIETEADVLSLVKQLDAGTYTVTVGVNNKTTGESATIEKEIVVEPYDFGKLSITLGTDNVVEYMYDSTDAVTLSTSWNTTAGETEMSAFTTDGYTVTLSESDTANFIVEYTNEGLEINSTDGATGYAGTTYNYTATFLSADGNYTGTKDFTVEIIASDKTMVTYDLNDTTKYIQIYMSASVVDDAGKLQSFTTATNKLDTNFTYKTLNISTTEEQNGVTITNTSLSGNFVESDGISYNEAWDINVQVDIDVNDDGIYEYSDPTAVLQLTVYKELKATVNPDTTSFAYGSTDTNEVAKILGVTLAGETISGYTVTISTSDNAAYVNDSFEITTLYSSEYIKLKNTSTLEEGNYNILIKLTTSDESQSTNVVLPVTITQGVYDGTVSDGLSGVLDSITVSYTDCYEPVQITTTGLTMNGATVEEGDYIISLDSVKGEYTWYDNEYFTIENNTIEYIGTSMDDDIYQVACLITSTDGNICSAATLQFSIKREWVYTTYYTTDSPYEIEYDKMSVFILDLMTVKYGDENEADLPYGTMGDYSFKSTPSCTEGTAEGMIYYADPDSDSYESQVEGLTFTIDDDGIITIDGEIPEEAMNTTLNLEVGNAYYIQGNGGVGSDSNIELYVQIVSKQIELMTEQATFDYGDDTSVSIAPTRLDGTSYDTTLELLEVTYTYGDLEADMTEEFALGANTISYVGDAKNLSVGTYTATVQLPESEEDCGLVSDTVIFTVEPRTLSKEDFSAFTDWETDESLDAVNGATKAISAAGAVEANTIFVEDDLNISYANHTALGIATVTISGNETNVTGSISYNYYIVPVINADGSITFDSVQLGVQYKLPATSNWKLENDQLTYFAGIAFYATSTDSLTFTPITE
ncbi:MAG: hypothetical protein R3Y58_12540, partial [Eubacteriales bacterium]